jgi:hypothetical protein
MVEDDTRGGKTAEQNGKRGCSGCAALFLIALPVLDVYVVLMSHSDPYTPVLCSLGAAGFVCGVVTGAFVSVKIMKDRWWSSCRWAIYGLVGMLFLPALLIFAGFLGRR